MLIDDGCEPTLFCHICAQALLAEVTAERDNLRAELAAAKEATRKAEAMLESAQSAPLIHAWVKLRTELAEAKAALASSKCNHTRTST
jgi:hypothetical protein